MNQDNVTNFFEEAVQTIRSAYDEEMSQSIRSHDRMADNSPPSSQAC
jgi:hypothetical protein